MAPRRPRGSSRRHGGRAASAADCRAAAAPLGLALCGAAALSASRCFDVLARPGRPAPPRAPAPPRRAPSSYLLWLNENRARLASELGTRASSEVCKEAGRQWGELGAGEKGEYVERAKKLREEHQALVREYRTAGGAIPRRPLTPYVRWLSEHRSEIASSLSAKPGRGAFLRAAGALWRELPEGERHRYRDSCRAAWAAYRQESGRSGRGSGEAEDPDAPRRPASAYALWLEDSCQQAAGAADERWEELPADERRRYEELHRNAEARYRRELRDYEARVGLGDAITLALSSVL